MALMTEAMKWCLIVTQSIRYAPDREDVYNELMAHIEDKIEALEEKGYTKEEAVGLAVDSMGDAKELGKELDRQHSYLIGKLYDISKKLLWIVGIFVLCYQLYQGGNLEELFKVEQNSSELYNEFHSEDIMIKTVPVEYKGTIGAYDVSVSKMVFYKEEQDTYEIVINLEVKKPFLKDWDPRNTLDRMKVYLDGEEVYNDHQHIELQWDRWENDPKVSIYNMTSGRGKVQYNICIYDVRKNYNQLTLSYQQYGYDDKLTFYIGEEGDR